MRTFLALVVLAGAAMGQAVRVDPLPVTTTAGNTPPGAYAPVLAIPGSTIKLCADAACAVRATAYTDQTAGATCPLSAPVVLSGTHQCISSADAQGNFGFWLLTGQYWYQITLPNTAVYGPFPLTAGASAMGAGVITWASRTGNVVPLSGDYNSLQIIAAANTVTFAATPTFDLGLGNVQIMTLSGTVTGAIVTPSTGGLMYEFLICQDIAGNHSFAWPNNVHGGMSVGLNSTKCSLQVFLGAGGQLYALTPGVTNQ